MLHFETLRILLHELSVADSTRKALISLCLTWFWYKTSLLMAASETCDVTTKITIFSFNVYHTSFAKYAFLILFFWINSLSKFKYRIFFWILYEFASDFDFLNYFESFFKLGRWLFWFFLWVLVWSLCSFELLLFRL